MGAHSWLRRRLPRLLGVPCRTLPCLRRAGPDRGGVSRGEGPHRTNLISPVMSEVPGEGWRRPLEL